MQLVALGAQDIYFEYITYSQCNPVYSGKYNFYTHIKNKKKIAPVTVHVPL